MEKNKKNFESEYLDLIKEDKERLKEKEKKQADLEIEIDDLKKMIKTLEDAYQKARGKSIPTKKKFDGVESIREACNILLKEKGEMKREKLIRELQDGGFNFKGKSPVRVVHLTMVNHPYATITEKGTYKLTNGEQKKSLLNLPKAVKKFFKQRENVPASFEEIFAEINKMKVQTATKDLKGSLKDTLTRRRKIIEKLEDGRYKLKQDIFKRLKVEMNYLKG